VQVNDQGVEEEIAAGGSVDCPDKEKSVFACRGKAGNTYSHISTGYALKG